MMNAKEVAKMYGISRTSLIEYEKQGLITSVKTPGGHRRYKQVDIAKLMNFATKKDFPPLIEIHYDNYCCLPLNVKLIVDVVGDPALDADWDANPLSNDDPDLGGVDLEYYKKIYPAFVENRFVFNDFPEYLRTIPTEIVLKSHDINPSFQCVQGNIKKYNLKNDSLFFNEIIDDINQSNKYHYTIQQSFNPNNLPLIRYNCDFPMCFLGKEFDSGTNTIKPVIYKRDVKPNYSLGNPQNSEQ